MGITIDWVRMLAYITGTVDQELLLRNEYLTAENRILKAQIKGRLLLSDVEKATLSEIAHRLSRKALKDVANSAKPDTLLDWYRKLVARKFDGSKSRRYPGRPRIDGEIEQLVVRMARENSGWGYDHIVGAMANLGYRLSDQTVGNILQRNGIPTAPARLRGALSTLLQPAITWRSPGSICSHPDSSRCPGGCALMPKTCASGKIGYL